MRSPQVEQGQGLKVVLAATVAPEAGVAEATSKLTETAYSRTVGGQEPVAGKLVLPARRSVAAARRQVPVERRLDEDNSNRTDTRRDSRRDSCNSTGAEGRLDQLRCR